ncbi:hypothetical protein FOXG_06145 [Fusarium oxysporum f. sp. lycopersici 4287]|uniref:Uncharacterized protein n=2 Tax=Fusarium oxysporum TaxID=5507 RepID=A0A0J9UYV6_FUSO4|nr:hypothetical protein FOXG_06145 [Fusarium oxysporum f. sp. lycopersici 4287]KNB03766.1 hypothetical protein FOXG_06145 [Fusarium oxysporum f. sp. lycopersici 4287]
MADADLVSTYLLESRRISRQRELEREIGCRATSAVDSPGQARSGTRRRPANNKQYVVAGQHKALRFTFTIQRSTDRSLRQDYSASVGAQAQALMARRGEGNKIDRAQLIGKEALICS